LSYRDAQKECKRRGLNAGGKKEEMKKRLLVDNSTICIDDEDENSEIENGAASDAYPSGTALFKKLRKSIETSVGFLAPQKIFLSKEEKKLSFDQIEQVESKLKEETKNPLEAEEIVPKDKKLEEKGIDQLTANNDLTNDDISILSYRDAQKECKRRGLNAGGKKEEMKKRILSDYANYSGTALLRNMKKSLESSIGFLSPQKVLSSNDEKKVSIDQTEQAKGKRDNFIVEEETKNPFEAKEMVIKDEKLEEKGIEQLIESNDLANDEISILSYREAQKECKRRGLNAGGKKEDMKNRLLLDNNENIPESICLSPSALSTMSGVTPFSSMERTQQLETQLQQDANYNHLSPVKEGEVEDLGSNKKRKRDKSQTKVDLSVTNKRGKGRKRNTSIKQIGKTK